MTPRDALAMAKGMQVDIDAVVANTPSAVELTTMTQDVAEAQKELSVLSDLILDLVKRRVIPFGLFQELSEQEAKVKTLLGEIAWKAESYEDGA